jgi:transposase-like protein
MPKESKKEAKPTDQDAQEAAPAAKPKRVKAAIRRAAKTRAKTKTKKPARRARPVAPRGARRGVAAKTRPARRRRFSEAERQRILATSRREQLTGTQVARRFGISQVTYYLWRKQARPAIRQVARTVRDSGVLDVGEEVRRQLRDRIREMVPQAIRSEINSVMNDLAGPPRRRRRASGR